MRVHILALVATAALSGCAATAATSAPPATDALPSPTPTPSVTEVPRGPGGWLVSNEAMVAFLFLSGTDDALTGTLAGSYVTPNTHDVTPFTASAFGSVADDGTMSIFLDPLPPFVTADQVTGRADGSVLELTYADYQADLVTLAFGRGDAAAYNDAVEALRVREQEAAWAEEVAQASAAAEEAAAVGLETCSRSVLNHAAVAWVYRPGGDAAKACTAIKELAIADGEWAKPRQPSDDALPSTLVCAGRIDNALVYIYDSGGLYYGGLACEDLTALPYMGIDIEPSSDGEGLKTPLDGVGTGTPAAKAGLRDRDMIVLVDLKPVRSELDLDAVLSGHGPGDTVPVYVLRDGEYIELTMKLGRRP